MRRHVRWSAVLAVALPLAMGEAAAESPADPAGHELPDQIVSLAPGVSSPYPIPSLRLRFDPRFVLEQVARHLGVRLDADAPLPMIYLESTTPLRQFQDAVEAQWGFRPRAFTNAYVIAHNEIYLTDNARYYLPHNRTLDDSLAHELVHYLQKKYYRVDPTSDWYEAEAIRVQERFRAAFPPAP